MAWEGDVLHNGAPVELGGYGRYENPWTQSAFPGDNIRFSHGDSYLELDFDSASREASAFME